MAKQVKSGRVFRGNYRLKDGSYKKSSYKLRIRVEVGEKYSPKVIDLGLGTRCRTEAYSRAKLALEYIQKINAYRKPALRIANASLQAPDYRVGQ